VVAPQDVNAFIQAGEKLANNASLRQTLGQNGRIYAEEHFDILRIGDQFEKIIRT
jgi:glycosyltransferase involved in cell wall biosynthesis